MTRYCPEEYSGADRRERWCRESRPDPKSGIVIERDAILESYSSVMYRNGGVGIRAATASCVGGFDPSAPFKGWVKGSGNDIPGPGEDGGNAEAALCPDYPGSLWPAGFLRADGSG